MPGIAVIVNPHARGNRRAPRRVARFQAIVGDDGSVAAPGSLDELDRTLTELHASAVEILAVCGGDGSLFHVLTRALRVWDTEPLPLVLPLRAGTINNLSRSVGCRRRRPEAMLAHVVKDYRRGRVHDVTERELILVNGTHYGYTVGLGMVVHFLRLYYSSQRPGPARAIWLLARLGLSYFLRTSMIRGVVKPFEADVTCDGERLPFRSYTLFIASSVAHVGLGVKPFYLGDRKSGAFHLLAGCSTPGELLSRLWRFFRGFPAGLDTLYDNLARDVRVELAEPQCMTINGDVLEEPVTVLEMRAGPRLRYIRG